ncbi:hypothetical protein NH286_04010 [Anaerococcus sp. NML200574]|uniref:hypothetical protein n=1 Tax=Anaerococcus sp. NML200574 TaxID=2954486 RepID=UPI002237C588|nr:hypothetical protein [Anaerococcus sp. NML200574]MCW6678313.1 hypothetical protein [Anaerococcus sp. NML200574]
METYTNKFHSKNLYIKIKDMSQIKPEDFDKLIKKSGKALQIGIYSDQEDVIAFIKKCGFRLRRVTYELEVGKADLKNPLIDKDLKLKKTTKGQKSYHTCLKLLYDYYKKTHQSINPLSLGLEEFACTIPENALYYEEKGQIIFAAFLEADEIAYISGFDLKNPKNLIGATLLEAYKTNDKIYFEADTTDPLASMMKDFFIVNSKPSYETYIKSK